MTFRSCGRAAALMALAGLLAAAPAADEPALTKVVADGVGATADDAVKDALRNAVRQVVGVLVDAETVVKNDDVIADKVLTLSNGFVKKYERLSEKADGGLVRVRVSAEVERGRVAARLIEVKVTVKTVDGTGALAEKLTKEEVRKDATALLRKAFAELPKAMVAEVVGEPKVKGGKYTFTVGVRADRELYAKAAKPLVEVLDKAAEDAKSVLPTLSGAWENRPFPSNGGLHVYANRIVPGPGLEYEFPAESLPALHKPADGGSTVWVAAPVDTYAAKVRWKGYAVPADMKAALAPLVGEYVTAVELLDKDGQVVTETEFPVTTGTSYATTWALQPHGHWVLAQARAVGPNPREPLASAYVWVAPFFMRVGGPYGDLNREYGYRLQVEYPQAVSLTDAELARVKTIRCKVELRPAKKN